MGDNTIQENETETGADLKDFKQKIMRELKDELKELKDELIRTIEHTFNSYNLTGSRTRNRYILVQRPRFVGDSINDSSYDTDPIF
jgi:hypothetical protein